MKIRNKVIICLMIIGISLFGIVEGVIIPKNNLKEKQYIANQKNPATHDLNSILKYRNKYMGNFSICNLFYTLPLNNIGMHFQLYPDKLTAEVNYKETVENIGDDEVKKALIYNSTAAFALIDNLEGIIYNFTGATYKVTRADMTKWYGEELTVLLSKDSWKSKVQDKLEDEKYVNKCAETVLKNQ